MCLRACIQLSLNHNYFSIGKKEKGRYFTENADGFYLLQVTCHMTTQVSRSGNCQVSYCILLKIFTITLIIMRYFVISFIKALNRENWHRTVKILHIVHEWYQRKLTWELKNSNMPNLWDAPTTDRTYLNQLPPFFTIWSYAVYYFRQIQASC